MVGMFLLKRGMSQVSAVVFVAYSPKFKSSNLCAGNPLGLRY